MKSYLAKPLEVERQWVVVDATDLVLGRMAARVAAILRGKHKPTFTPHVDTGDFVIIINAEKIRITSDKLLTKFRYHHSNFPGGLKAYPLGRQMEKNPAEVVRRTVKGMLPHTVLGRHMITQIESICRRPASACGTAAERYHGDISAITADRRG